jgi:hypothetical protein
MTRLITFLNQSQLWVALAAASLCAETFVLVGDPPRTLIVLQAFFLTWCAYLFLKRDLSLKWQKPLQYIAITGAVVTAGYNPNFHWPSMVVALVAVLFYQKDWLHEMGLRMPMEWRSVSWLKPLVIAAGWTVVTSIASAATAVGSEEAVHGVFIYTNFFFVLALSLLADVRDANIDAPRYTLVQRMGTKVSKALILFFIAFSSVGIMAALMHQGIHSRTGIAFGTVLLLTMLLALATRPKSNWQWQAFAADAVLIVRLAAVVIAEAW